MIQIWLTSSKNANYVRKRKHLLHFIRVFMEIHIQQLLRIPLCYCYYHFALPLWNQTTFLLLLRTITTSENKIFSFWEILIVRVYKSPFIPSVIYCRIKKLLEYQIASFQWIWVKLTDFIPHSVNFQLSSYYARVWGYNLATASVIDHTDSQSSKSIQTYIFHNKCFINWTVDLFSCSFWAWALSVIFHSRLPRLHKPLMICLFTNESYQKYLLGEGTYSFHI